MNKKGVFLATILLSFTSAYSETKYEIADKELNENYQNIMKTLSELDREKLRNEQRDWIGTACIITVILLAYSK